MNEAERWLKDHNEWLKERNEVLYTFDVDEFKKFYRKWTERGVYDKPLPSDEVIEIAMRKCVCGLANPRTDKLVEARTWLSERGLSWTMTREKAVWWLEWLKKVHSERWIREALDEAIEALSADAVSRESYINAVGYVEWLEKLIVDQGTFEWLCEDTNDEEWCKGNCHYLSIQAECLRHLYEVGKGGDEA